MKTLSNGRRARRSFTILGTCVAGLILAAGAAAQESARGTIESIWNDPTFQRQFVAAYGVNAEIEPRVTLDEFGILEKVRPLMAANDLAKAEAALKKAMKPDCSAILDFTLAGIHFQQENFDSALESYDKAIKKFPSFRRAWRNLGLIQVRQGKYDPAIAAFVRMLELGGGDAYSYGLLGFAYSSKQDYQPAEAAYRNALLLQPENTEWRLGLTRCVFRQGKFEDCASLLEVLIARYPDKAEFWLLQAHAYLGLKQPLKAAVNLEAIDRLGLASVDSAHTLADIYVGENLLDLAARAYLRAIDVDVNQPISRPMRAAEILASRGTPQLAREVLGRINSSWAGRIEPIERQKLLKLDARLAMADGSENEETASVLEEIVKVDPLDGEALMLLAKHYSRTSQPDRAIFYYERAASLDAYAPQALISQAQVLVGMGRYSDALAPLRRTQELKPREDIARYLEQVERLSKSQR